MLHAEKGFHVIKELVARIFLLFWSLQELICIEILFQRKLQKEHCLRSIQLASAIVVLHKNAVSDLLKVVSSQGTDFRSFTVSCRF